MLNHTYCLSFYFYVAASRRRPSAMSLLVYVTPDQVHCTVDIVIVSDIIYMLVSSSEQFLRFFVKTDPLW